MNVLTFKKNFFITRVMLFKQIFIEKISIIILSF